jgi:hypothetical protein
MDFEVQQPLFKHNDYYFENVIHYTGHTNFTKQYKVTPNMGWPLSCDTRVTSHLHH